MSTNALGDASMSAGNTMVVSTAADVGFTSISRRQAAASALSAGLQSNGPATHTTTLVHRGQPDRDGTTYDARGAND
jgi:hypothetical protein